ncbi:MAG: insulinase family protein [Clostridia bacterium]|nr:insulinase family protein [Clostridia bacterium]
MIPKRENIGNGVGFCFYKTDKFKTDRIDVRFVVPLDEKTASENALVFPVLFRATEKYPSTLDMRVACETLYGASFDDGVSKRGDAQVITFSSSFLSPKYAIGGDDILGGALDLISEVMLRPKTENGVFCAEYVDSEKKMLIDDELAKVNDKRRYAQQRLTEEMFEGTPFALSESGRIEDIKAVTPASLYAAYKSLLGRARVEICAVGDMDGERVKAFFADLFGKIDRDPVPPVETAAMKGARESVKNVREHQNVTQGKLSLGFATGVSKKDGKDHVLDVTMKIFGSGTTSKLFMNVREKLSLCYYCSAGANSLKGYMVVNSGIMFENEKKAVDEIMLQLGEVARGNITDEEMTAAKSEIVNRYNRIFDNGGSISGYVFGKIIDGDDETPEEKIKKVLSVTKEQVSDMAKGFKLDTYYFLCGKEGANE